MLYPCLPISHSLYPRATLHYDQQRKHVATLILHTHGYFDAGLGFIAGSVYVLDFVGRLGTQRVLGGY
jgi:hypothetical protein